MKKIIGRWLTISVVFLVCVTGCMQSPKSQHYELVGGTPEIDYIDFLNDTLCRYVVPGPLTFTTRYTQEGDTYIIHINSTIKARLYKTDEGNLRGEAPFFEGIWVKKK
ncbi:hypothetical protein D0T50_00910 [Bacteroides sp. 214]|nr:hypothetical protein [Bacteroides sp. 214]